jgi:hypothetical protein
LKCSALYGNWENIFSFYGTHSGYEKVKLKALFLTLDLLKIFEDLTLIILDTNKFFRRSVVSIALFSTSGGELLKKTADTLFN